MGALLATRHSPLAVSVSRHPSEPLRLSWASGPLCCQCWGAAEGAAPGEVTPSVSRESWGTLGDASPVSTGTSGPSVEQHHPGESRRSGSDSQCRGSWTRLGGHCAGVGGGCCFAGWRGWGRHHSTHHETWEGGVRAQGSWSTAVEVEEVSGASKVSVPGWPKAAPCHSRGWWVPGICLLGCLCCAEFSPGLGSWGHFLLITSLFSLISRPVADLAPGELRRSCVALSWLWVSDGGIVQWLVHWYGRRLLLVDELVVCPSQAVSLGSPGAGSGCRV